MGLTWFGRTQEGLQRDEGRANRKSWGPLVLQNVKTDGAGLRADVGVPNFCVEFHL